MHTMQYRGYTARIEFDKADRIFVGHLAGIKDIVGFHGTTVDELERAFHESVDAYVDAYKEKTSFSLPPTEDIRLTNTTHKRAHADTLTQLSEPEGED